ncbi:MAG: hypothetical protein H0X27_04455 [Caulobacteraceae bacterium]|nr:hypothetical protein [Caulobacteraceae bacterium]
MNRVRLTKELGGLKIKRTLSSGRWLLVCDESVSSLFDEWEIGPERRLALKDIPNSIGQAKPVDFAVVCTEKPEGAVQQTLKEHGVASAGLYSQVIPRLAAGVPARFHAPRLEAGCGVRHHVPSEVRQHARLAGIEADGRRRSGRAFPGLRSDFASGAGSWTEAVRIDRLFVNAFDAGAPSRMSARRSMAGPGERGHAVAPSGGRRGFSTAIFKDSALWVLADASAR